MEVLMLLRVLHRPTGDGILHRSVRRLQDIQVAQTACPVRRTDCRLPGDHVPDGKRPPHDWWNLLADLHILPVGSPLAAACLSLNQFADLLEFHIAVSVNRPVEQELGPHLGRPDHRPGGFAYDFIPLIPIGDFRDDKD